MSLFSDLASNQMVTQAVAATAGFPLKAGQSHGSSNQCMTKLEATTKYNLKTDNLTAYADNQLIPKSVWATGFVQMYYRYFTSFPKSTGALSCQTDNTTSAIQTLYMSTLMPMLVGQVIYTDEDGLFTFNGGNNFWGVLVGDAIVPGTTSTDSYRISSAGVIMEIVNCNKPSNGFVLTPGTITSSSLQFSWSLYGDHTGLVNFQVYRDNVLVSTVSNTTYTFTDPGRSANTTYTYHIRGIYSPANPLGVAFSNDLPMKTTVTTGGTFTLDIPGVGNGIAPAAVGSNIRSGYTFNSSIRINNIHTSQTILFSLASIPPVYPIVGFSGAARLMVYSGSVSVNFNTAPGDGEMIGPNSYASWLSFGKSSGSGLVVLSLEYINSSGTESAVFWTLSI